MKPLDDDVDIILFVDCYINTSTSTLSLKLQHVDICESLYEKHNICQKFEYHS